MGKFMIGTVREYERQSNNGKIIGLDIIDSSTNEIKFYDFQTLKSLTDRGMLITNLKVTDRGLDTLYTSLDDYRVRVEAKNGRSIVKNDKKMLVIDRTEQTNLYSVIHLKEEKIIYLTQKELIKYQKILDYRVVNINISSEYGFLVPLDDENADINSYNQLSEELKGYVAKSKLIRADHVEIGVNSNNEVYATVDFDRMEDLGVKDIIIPRGVNLLNLDGKDSTLESINYVQIPDTVNLISEQFPFDAKIEKLSLSIGKDGIDCEDFIDQNEIGELIIKTNLSVIPDNLFYNAAVDKISLNKPMESLGNNSFILSENSDLSGLSIGTIERHTFRVSNDGDTLFKFPKNIKTMRKDSVTFMYQFKKMYTIELPTSLEYVEAGCIKCDWAKIIINSDFFAEEKAFWDCEAEEIEINSEFSNINSYFVSTCKLKSVTINGIIGQINKNAFTSKSNILSIDDVPYKFNENGLDVLYKLEFKKKPLMIDSSAIKGAYIPALILDENIRTETNERTGPEIQYCLIDNLYINNNSVLDIQALYKCRVGNLEIHSDRYMMTSSLLSCKVEKLKLTGESEAIAPEFMKEASVNVLELNESIKDICAEAFYNCRISKLFVPKNVRNIDKYSFANNYMKELVFEQGCEAHIQSGAFQHNSFTKVTLRYGMTFSKDAFDPTVSINFE